MSFLSYLSKLHVDNQLDSTSRSIEVPVDNNNNEPNVLPDIPVPAQYGILVILTAIILKTFITPGLVRLRKYIEEPEYDNINVISLLNQLLALSKGDRTAICMFHNGEKFSNGSHYWKLTMTHEAVNAGVSRISRDFKALPISQIAEFLEKVRLSSSLTHIEANAKYDSVFSEYLADAGAEAVITNLIKDNDNKEVALLFIYYTHSTPSHAALSEISNSEAVSRILAQIKREITSAQKNNTALVLLSYGLKFLGF